MTLIRVENAAEGKRENVRQSGRRFNATKLTVRDGVAVREKIALSRISKRYSSTTRKDAYAGNKIFQESLESADKVNNY
ncbi:MAG: hypothetical protein ACTS42_00195 [Candidatus Hodgkinia cicadicola]